MSQSKRVHENPNKRNYKPNDQYRPRYDKETDARRDNTRNSEIDRRRNVPSYDERDRRELDMMDRIDRLEKEREQAKKQQNSANTTTPTQNDQKTRDSKQPAKNDLNLPLATDVFIGTNDFLHNTEDVQKTKEILKPPHLLSVIKCTTKTFKFEKLPEDRTCRNLIIAIDPSHYMTNDTDYFKKDGDLTSNAKYNQAITDIQSNLKNAVNFYKPAETFVQIIDRCDKPTLFWGIVKLVCHTQNFIPMEMNRKNQVHLATLTDKKEERKYVWRARIKTYLHQFHPKTRDLSNMSPEKMLHF